MATYVDDMYLYPIGQFQRGGRLYKMSHLIADTQNELLAMCIHIGVATQWIQYPGTPREHFDITMTKRELAIKAGAIDIPYRTLSMMTLRREVIGSLGIPLDAEQWWTRYSRARRRRAANGQR